MSSRRSLWKARGRCRPGRQCFVVKACCCIFFAFIALKEWWALLGVAQSWFLQQQTNNDEGPRLVFLAPSNGPNNQLTEVLELLCWFFDEDSLQLAPPAVLPHYTTLGASPNLIAPSAQFDYGAFDPHFANPTDDPRARFRQQCAAEDVTVILSTDPNIRPKAEKKIRARYVFGGYNVVFADRRNLTAVVRATRGCVILSGFYKQLDNYLILTDAFRKDAGVNPGVVSLAHACLRCPHWDTILRRFSLIAPNTTSIASIPRPAVYDICLHMRFPDRHFRNDTYVEEKLKPHEGLGAEVLTILSIHRPRSIYVMSNSLRAHECIASMALPGTVVVPDEMVERGIGTIFDSMRVCAESHHVVASETSTVSFIMGLHRKFERMSYFRSPVVGIDKPGDKGCSTR